MVHISIIIPVYNVSAYLTECVESVLKQTYKNIELIMINDGSTDNSGTMCDEFAQKDTRVRVIHQENGGLSAARNVGISLASGEYIIFLDSDDFWKDENVLKALAERLEDMKPDVLSFNYVKFDGGRNYKPYFDCESMSVRADGAFRYIADRGLWIACAWNKVIKRTIFENGDLRFVEGVTSEDMDWCVRLALKAERFDYLDMVVVCYRQRESSISQSSTPKKVSTVMSNIERCLALLENNKSDRIEQLKSFVGYQYGTVLFHLAHLPVSEEQDTLIVQAKKYQHLLKWSDSRKVKFLDVVTSVFGLNLTLFLLKLKNG